MLYFSDMSNLKSVKQANYLKYKEFSEQAKTGPYDFWSMVWELHSTTYGVIGMFLESLLKVDDSEMTERE